VSIAFFMPNFRLVTSNTVQILTIKSGLSTC
jgi:hypothetical protein